MRRVNALAADVEYVGDRPPGYGAGFVELGPGLGAAKVGVSVCELPPGESSDPYHYEYGNEEWLIVLAGRPTLRHPGGEDELEPGDVVLFPVGPEGAHKLMNRGDAAARVLFLSTKHRPGGPPATAPASSSSDLGSARPRSACPSASCRPARAATPTTTSTATRSG